MRKATLVSPSQEMTTAETNGNTVQKQNCSPGASRGPSCSSSDMPLASGGTGKFTERPPHEIPSSWSSSETCIWLAFFCSCSTAYFCFCDGEISALLTLSAAVFMLSTVFLVFHARVCYSVTQAFCQTYSASGADGASTASSRTSFHTASIVHLLCGGSACPKSAAVFALAILARVACNLSRPAYLPIDRSGDWLYQTLEVFSALLLVLLLGVVSVSCRQCQHITERTVAESTQGKDGETTIQLNDQKATFTSGCRFIFVAAVVCGLVLKHDLNESFLEDFAWSFAMYAETLAFIPFLRRQLFAVRTARQPAAHKKEDQRTALTENDDAILVDHRYHRNPVLARRLWRQFLFCLVVSRVIQVTFWAVTFDEFSPEGDPESLEMPTEKSESPAHTDGSVPQEPEWMAKVAIASRNIRGWFSLAAVVAQLCFSLYCMRVYISTQSDLEQKYSGDRKAAEGKETEDTAAPCTEAGAGSASLTEKETEQEKPEKPTQVRKRLVLSKQ
ncbi:hypothetical protein BESB_076880 [Besnoitia besnoiti]|uniref:Transmembrane protein n=1 Tax=Besnoitia besnoiti TaxID=94643 RepID=A0A2A9MAY3_BESBE|nr:hypothetical protein BESB_076880 [Besnoitia besnoiti]PFH33471.1 hypothetical protein BESB_076880 [Besnoitia besnoiti]